MTHSFTSFALLAATCLLAGCGGSVYQPSRSAGFHIEAPQEINDDDIAKAFAARPQLPDKPAVAYYVFDDDYADEVEQMLEEVPSLSSRYRIPAVLVNGQRRFAEASVYEPADPISIKELRLHAARAHAELLVVVDYGYRVTDSANGFAALGVVLVPLLFVPFRDLTVKSYVDSYVIDTKNGYLYGHIQTADEQTSEYETIYSGVGDALVKGQLTKLVGETEALLVKLLKEERVVSHSPLAAEAGREAPGDPATSARQSVDVGQSR